MWLLVDPYRPMGQELCGAKCQYKQHDFLSFCGFGVGFVSVLPFVSFFGSVFFGGYTSTSGAWTRERPRWKQGTKRGKQKQKMWGKFPWGKFLFPCSKEIDQTKQFNSIQSDVYCPVTKMCFCPFAFCLSFLSSQHHHGFNPNPVLLGVGELSALSCVLSFVLPWSPLLSWRCLIVLWSCRSLAFLVQCGVLCCVELHGIIVFYCVVLFFFPVLCCALFYRSLLSWFDLYGSEWGTGNARNSNGLVELLKILWKKSGILDSHEDVKTSPGLPAQSFFSWRTADLTSTMKGIFEHNHQQLQAQGRTVAIAS